MNKKIFSTRVLKNPRFRFALELGVCILIALAAILYFSPKGDSREGEQVLHEMEANLDQLESIRTYLSKDTRYVRRIAQLKLDLLRFNEDLLKGIDGKYPLDPLKASDLRRRIKDMKEHEELILKITEGIYLPDEAQKEGRENLRKKILEIEQKAEKEKAEMYFADPLLNEFDHVFYDK